MKELLMQLSFKQFLKTPFSWIFLSAIIALVYLGNELIESKNIEVNHYKNQVDDCYDDQKKQNKLLQDIVFENKFNKMLHEINDTTIYGN